MPRFQAHRWLRHPPNWLLLAGAFYPLLWLNGFAIFVLRARALLGRWPSPYNPDPKDLGLDIHHTLLVFGLVLIPTLGLGTVIAALGARWRSREVPWLLVLFTALMPLLTVAWLRWDPGNFIEWFTD